MRDGHDDSRSVKMQSGDIRFCYERRRYVELLHWHCNLGFTTWSVEDILSGERFDVNYYMLGEPAIEMEVIAWATSECL